MKKILLFSLLAATISFFMGCISKTDKDKGKNPGKEDVTQDEDDADSDFKKQSLNYCDCLDQAFEDIDPKLKKLFAKTADIKDPSVSLANELNKLDQEEYEAMASELKRLSVNTEAKVCGKAMKKKSGINIDDDVDDIRKILRVIEENDGGQSFVSVR